MIRRLFLPLGLLATLAQGHAATRHLSIPASGLAIASPCAREITILPDPAATTIVSADATADHEEEADGLVLSGGEAPTLKGPERCWRPPFALDFRSTMAITIHVPPRSALKIEENGAATYTIADLGSSLTVDLSGDVRLAAISATALDAELSGSGGMTVARVTGRTHAELSGAANLSIARGDMSDADFDLSGAGGVSIAGGSIGKLKLAVSGSADVTLGGTVGDASVEISGSSTVRIARLTGRLSKDISGSGDVQVGAK